MTDRCKYVVAWKVLGGGGGGAKLKSNKRQKKVYKFI